MQRKDIAFEESLSEDWSSDLEVVEVPLKRSVLMYLGFLLFLAAVLIGGRMAYLGIFNNGIYESRAESNLNAITRISAPRALIVDRFGKLLADNKMVFKALLNSKEFLKNKDTQQDTLNAIQNILGIASDTIWNSLGDKATRLDDFTLPLILSPNLTQSQVLQLKSLNLSTLIIENGYTRNYPQGPVFSTVLGYVGLASPEDLKSNSDLSNEDLVGKAGLEAYYDKTLQGVPGEIVKTRNAQGEIIGDEKTTDPQQPAPFRTTLDGDLQNYFYTRMQEGLRSLGRTSGAGLVINPQTGEILSLVNLPSYDPNVFIDPSKASERADLLTSPLKPLFDKISSGLYSPGSVIKPLMGVAALKENVISPTRTIFSPGYLDIPNPYNPSKPTRYMDWRPQGNVDMAAAIAQSSDVYFYEVGGGWKDIPGLGITRIIDWWKKFNLDKKTGVDLPNESSGFLPSPDWKQKYFGTPWVLGDTFNISIGQGDLQITPLELVTYIDSLVNGGKFYAPYLNANLSPKVNGDISDLMPEIKEVQKGMVETVTSPLGTANTLADLPFSVGAKTGSAQIMNNTQENAFFVGYAPVDNPQIAVLVLIENSKQGSLNAVPIAKDVLKWYYDNRMNK